MHTCIYCAYIMKTPTKKNTQSPGDQMTRRTQYFRRASLVLVRQAARRRGTTASDVIRRMVDAGLAAEP